MKDVATNHLKRIGSRYYMVRRVPVDLASEYTGKFIKRSLGTSDWQDAKELLRVALVRLDQEFAEKRRKVAATSVSEISDSEIDRLAAIWLADVHEEAEEFTREGVNGRSYDQPVARSEESSGGEK